MAELEGVVSCNFSDHWSMSCVWAETQADLKWKHNFLFPLTVRVGVTGLNQLLTQRWWRPVGHWAPPAPLFTSQWLCQFLLQNISSVMATALLWKSCCIRICAQVVKSVFHRIEIARLNRNTSYLMLLADGPSVNISIMEFRAHSQKFANSSQHQSKLNNAVALELWKGDMFSNIRADWLFTA